MSESQSISECLSPEVITAYLEGIISESEQHRIEKHLLDCPFCSDAIDGIKKLNDNKLIGITIDLNQQIKTKAQEKSKNYISLSNRRKHTITYTIISIAASILLFIGVFTTYQKYYNKHENLMVENSTAQEVAKGNIKSKTETIAITKNDGIIVSDKKQNIESVDGNSSKALSTIDIVTINGLAKGKVKSDEAIEKTQNIKFDKNLADKNLADKDINESNNLPPVASASANKVESTNEKTKIKEEAKDNIVSDKLSAEILVEIKEADFDTLQLAYNDDIDNINQSPILLDEIESEYFRSDNEIENKDLRRTKNFNSGRKSKSKKSSAAGGYAPANKNTITKKDNNLADLSEAEEEHEITEDYFKPSENKKSKSPKDTKSSQSSINGILYNNAISYLENNQINEAIISLEMVVATKDTKYLFDAQWKLANAYLKNKQTEKAKSIFTTITNQNGKYQNKAKKELEKFNK